jgi:polyvinyl alcohol dehydrogenase (cytochrome)
MAKSTNSHRGLPRWYAGPALSAVVVLSFVPLVFGGLQASAASPDWTTYGWTNGRTGFNGAETAITPSSAPQLQLAWSATSQNVSPNLVFSQPVVSNGLVYWASMDGYERAANTSGDLVWQTYIGRTSACGFTDGPASTATVANGVVYVGGGDAQIYALDAQTGSVLWQTRLGPSPSTFAWASPALYNGNVYMGVSSYADCPLIQGQLVELSSTTGALENTFNTVPNGCIGASVWGSPTVDEAKGTIYFATGNGGSCSTAEPYAEAVIEVRASDLGLVGSWQIPVNQQISDGDFGSTPTLFTVSQNGTPRTMVALANKNGLYYALEADNLAAGPQWSIRIDDGGNCPNCGKGAIAPSAWDGTSLYVGGTAAKINGVSCAGTITALNPTTGATVWTRCLPDGAVLGAVAAAPGIVAVGEGNKLLLLSATSGQTLYSYTTQSTIWGAPSIVDGVLYVGDNGGSLYALSLNPVTNVLIPSNGGSLSGAGSLSGSQYLDASASSNTTRVEFRLTGGSLNDALIATATPTYYGWIAGWDTTSVQNGTYTLQSEAYYSNGASGTSPAITLTVYNQPTTTVRLPSNNSSPSGTQWLDASATSATSVQFFLFGGTFGYSAHPLCTATSTIDGWLCSWNTTTVPDGSYALLSEAFNSAGSSTFSSGISITVAN